MVGLACRLEELEGARWVRRAEKGRTYKRGSVVRSKAGIDVQEGPSNVGGGRCDCSPIFSCVEGEVPPPLPSIPTPQLFELFSAEV